MSTPREQFKLLDKTNVLVPFSSAIESYPMRTAMTHALAEMTVRGATSEQLAGAVNFSNILTKLASDNDVPTMPVKSLQSDLGGGELPDPKSKQQKEEKKKK